VAGCVTPEALSQQAGDLTTSVLVSTGTDIPHAKGPPPAMRNLPWPCRSAQPRLLPEATGATPFSRDVFSLVRADSSTVSSGSPHSDTQGSLALPQGGRRSPITVLGGNQAWLASRITRFGCDERARQRWRSRLCFCRTVSALIGQLQYQRFVSEWIGRLMAPG